jgi:hypothetical protein
VFFLFSNWQYEMLFFQYLLKNTTEKDKFFFSCNEHVLGHIIKSVTYFCIRYNLHNNYQCATISLKLLTLLQYLWQYKQDLTKDDRFDVASNEVCATELQKV